MENNHQHNLIESFDFKAFGSRILKYWHLFVISLLIGAGISYYNLRYSVNVYSTYSKVLLKDEYSSWGQEYFIKGMELVSAHNRLSNEVGILNSYSLNRKVLNTLDFDVFYYDLGRMKTSELYNKSPFIVEVDTTINHSNFPFYYLKFIDSTSYYVSTNPEEIEKAKPHRFGKPVILNNIELTIEITANYAQLKSEKKLYGFLINDLNSLAKVYQGKVELETDPPESSILKFSMAGTKVEKDINYLNALMRVYIQDGLDENNQITSNTLRFIDVQLNEIADTLIKVETKLERFKATINDDKLEINTTKLIPDFAKLEEKLIDTKFNIKYYKNTLDYLLKNDNVDDVVIPTILDVNIQDPIYKTITELTRLYNRKASLSFSIKDSSLVYAQLLQQIEMTKKILTENLRARLSKKEFEIEQLTEQLNLNENKLGKLPPAESDYVRIQRIYKLNNDFYNYLLQKRGEAALAQASNVPKAKIIENASNYTVSFVGPNRRSIYLLNLGIAFMIPFVLVLFNFLFNTKIIEKSDIESTTNIPIIGNIGHIKDAGNLVLVNKPKSVVAESFRSIRTNINYLTKKKETFCILVTSSIAGEGKTFSSINLALAYSISGKKTLIIGADLRKPKLFDDFNLNNNIGLSNYLIGKSSFEEVIQTTEYEDLHLVSSGPTPPNPSELIETEEMKTFIEMAKKTYDAIIIDTPPIGLVTDAMILSKFSDVNLYIVRQHYTRKNQLELVNDLFNAKKIKHLGIIVNDIKEQRIGYGKYKYGYGYGYNRSNYYEEDIVRKKSILDRIIKRS